MKSNYNINGKIEGPSSKAARLGKPQYVVELRDGDETAIRLYGDLKWFNKFSAPDGLTAHHIATYYPRQSDDDRYAGHVAAGTGLIER